MCKFQIKPDIFAYFKKKMETVFLLQVLYPTVMMISLILLCSKICQMLIASRTIHKQSTQMRQWPFETFNPTNYNDKKK